jgi:ferredoxin
MPKVTFTTDKKDVEVPAGANLRTEATRAGIEVYSGVERYVNCRGNGMCGTCRVMVKKGMENLSPKTTIERLKLSTMMSAIGHENEMRLACQVKVNGDCSVEATPALNLYGENFWQKPYPNK